MEIPTPVAGTVSDPAAEVKVNGVKVNVKTDGTFVAQILSVKGINNVEAVATLGNDNDRAFLEWYMGNNGQLGYIPGIFYTQSVLPAVTVKAGESASFDFSMVFSQHISASTVNSIKIVRTAELRNQSLNLPMLPGLKVSVEPSMYSTYPRIQYYSQVTIDTSPDLTSGDYYFSISPSLEQNVYFNGYNYLSVTSTINTTSPPAGAIFKVSVK